MDKYDKLKEYSSGSLFKAAINCLLKKRFVRIAMSAAAVVVSLLAMEIVSRYHGGAPWWVARLYFLPFFIMFTVGAGGLISNIGRFGTRGFILASTASAIALWAVMSVYRVIAWAYLPIDRAVLFPAIGSELLRLIPLLLVSETFVILPALILSHKVNKQ